MQPMIAPPFFHKHTDRVRVTFLSSLFILATLTGCPTIFTGDSRSPSHLPIHHNRLRASTIDRLAPLAQPVIQEQVGPWSRTVLASHAIAADVPARQKRRIALQSLTDPWTGYSTLEHQGLLLTELAEAGSENLPAILDVMEAAADRTSEYFKPVPFPGTSNQEEIVQFLLDSLEEASIQRDDALANLSDEERLFLFAHAKTLAEQFSPRPESPGQNRHSQAVKDARYVDLLSEQVNYAALITSAQVLARLANERFLQQLSAAFQRASPLAQPLAGITGEVLLTRQTRAGLIVIGGPGRNTYDLDGRTILIIDVGGDDTYRGAIASSTDINRGISTVIDLGGNDTYTSGTLGLATGRLGVGLLIDQAGDDVYQLGVGSGGTGFGGLGILFDRQGNDVYMGNRFTQGAALGGLGLLIDTAGNDRYTSYGFAIGFGGPLGIGVVLDLAGDDSYQCGDKYPSPFNQEDAPHTQAGDRQFQYVCNGMGAGAGVDFGSVLTGKSDLNLAGGLGYLLDAKGQDRYRSSNHAQGFGYFFGVGLAMDIGGNDDYRAARAGLGSSIHFGIGLFLNIEGNDQYFSSGPRSNLAAGTNHSVALAADAGSGKDSYDLMLSDGLGIAERGAWTLFIDEAGDDSYRVPSGLGKGSQESLGQFIDLGGSDQYTDGEKTGSTAQGRSNGRTLVTQGSLFVDR